MSYATVGTVQDAEREDHSEHVQLLKAMFDEWDDGTLGLVLSASGGSVETAIDAILAAGSPEIFRAQQAPTPAPPPPERSDPAVAQQQHVMAQIQTQQQQQPQVQYQLPQQPQQQQVVAPAQDMVMVTAPQGTSPGAVLSISHNGQPFYVRVPDGVAPGAQFVVNLPRSAPPVVAVAGRGGAATAQPQQQDQMLLEQQLIQQQMFQQQQQQQQPSQPPQQQQQQQQQRAKKGRGSSVSLPASFLRPPGWKGSSSSGGGGGSSSSPFGLGPGGTELGAVGVGGDTANPTSGMSGEQLAILLQDELFLQELSSHPEFRSVQEQLYSGQPGASSSSARTQAGVQRGGGGSRATAAAGSGSGGGSSSTGTNWSAAMRNRLKTVGAVFNSKRKQQQGYGEVATTSGPASGADGADASVATSSEESPFHWSDDNVLPPAAGGDDDEAGSAQDHQQQQRSADDILRGQRAATAGAVEEGSGALSPASGGSGSGGEWSSLPVMLRAPRDGTSSAGDDFKGFAPAAEGFVETDGAGGDSLLLGMFGPGGPHAQDGAGSVDASLVEISFDDGDGDLNKDKDVGLNGTAAAPRTNGPGGSNGSRQVFDL